MPRLFGQVALVLAFLLVGSATAQPTVSWSTLAYLDYVQPIHSHSEDAHGAFQVRRLYLTADATTESAFSGRARLEVNARNASERGLPVPFIKDLFVRWRAESGHRLTFGIQSPPAFQVAEAVWGYRSLARSLADASGAVSSRDFGLAATGPIAGDVGYGIMVGNNEGVRVEDDAHKRIYGQIRWRPNPFVFTLHTDYASYGDERDDAVTLSAFAGVATDRLRAGVEGVWQHTRLRADEEDLRGVGVFAVVALASRIEFVVRSHWEEFSSTVAPFPEDDDTPRGPSYLLGALSFAPTEGIQLIPNVYWEDPDDDSDVVVARFTLFASF